MKFLNVKDVDLALELILKEFQALPRLEKVDILQSLGRIAGEDFIATECLPNFARSSVDGYAVMASDTFGSQEGLPALLINLEEIMMGCTADPINFGHCRYIPTGGMLPPEADAVVMIEHTEIMGDLVCVYKQVAPGENVIKPGDDIETNSTIFEEGRVFRVPDIAALAALGIQEVPVIEKPRVAIISTGNELVPYHTQNLKKGKVRDINSVSIMLAVQEAGADVIWHGIIEDNYQAFVKKLEELVKLADMIILSGGSSVGTKDYTAQALSEISKGQMLIEGLSVKPGKPTLLARIENKPILGLPGHPAAALIIFQTLGLPLLKILKGEKSRNLIPIVRARLTKNVPSQSGRTDYISVKLTKQNSEILAEPIFGKSGLITTLVQCDGLVRVDKKAEGLLAGTIVNVELLFTKEV